MSGIERQVLDRVLLMAVIAVAIVTWQIYRRLFGQLRHEARDLHDPLASGRAR